MRQHWKLPLAFVCLLALASLPLLHAPRGSAQSVTYTVTDIGAPGGAASSGYGLDECGKVVGEFEPAGQTSRRPFVWAEGTLTDIGTFGGPAGRARSVNTAGSVTGSATTAVGMDRPFVWTAANGKTDLGSPGSTAVAFDINESGLVVGQVDAGSGGAIQERAFVWTSGTGMQHVAPAAWGTPSAAYGVNDAGHVVGTAQTTSVASHAFLLSGGVLTEIGALGGTNSFAFEVNESGVVVGYANTTAGISPQFHAFRWTAATNIQDLGTLGGARSQALDVNDAGVIVGFAQNAGGAPLAFIWKDDNANNAPDAGEMKDLNAVAPGTGWTFQEARAINDRGQIVGVGVNPSGQTRAFLLTPSNVGPSPCDATPTPTPTPTPVPGSLQFSSPTYTVSENGVSATINVSRAGGDDGAVSVNYATSNGTATAGGEYTAASGTLNWADGDSAAKSFTVAVANDALDEPNKTVNLSLSSPGGGAALGSQTTAVLTIADDDATPTLSITKSVTVVEGHNAFPPKIATFVVKLTGASAQTVTVSYDTEWTAGTATAGEDYTRASGVITYAPGESGEKNVEVEVLGDTVDEPNETFVLQLFGPKNATYVTIPDDTFGVGAITDDDGAPSLSVGDATVTEGATGATAATFTVSLLPASGQTVTVNYATANGTATAGDDYASAGGTLTFAPGETTKPVTVNVSGDTTPEAHETFFVNLSDAPLATITDNQGKGAINNDDTSISISDRSLAEGNTGNTAFAFVVTLSHATVNTVSVGYATASGAATAGSDYTAINSGTLTFNPGDTSETATVQVVGDNIYENDENFFVNLSSPTNATITDNQAQGTITNDEEASLFEFSGGPTFNASEGDGTVKLRISRSGATPGGVQVSYSTSGGTATAGSDYTAASGTLTFEAGESFKDINVTIINDTLDEADETFNVTLTPGFGASANPGSATLHIQDDDAAPTFQFGSATYTVAENVGAVTVEVKRTGGTNAASVTYGDAGNGTATSGSDYATVGNGTLSFAEGDMSKTFTVTVKEDTLDEPSETVNLTLSSPVGGTVVSGSATLNITDNDEPPTFKFDPASYTVAENVGAVIVTVKRTGGTNASSVTYEDAGSGTAAAGSDYTPPNGTLAFAEGETSKTFSVTVKEDTLDEPSETVNLTLISPVGGLVSGGTATLNINDNDEPPTFKFSSATYAVSEGAPFGAPSLTVTRTGGTNAATVTYGDAGSGTATSGSDYATVGNGTLSFAEGDMSKTFSVAVLDDASDEPDETVNLFLAAGAGAVTGSPHIATLTITDDDDAPTLAVTGASTQDVTVHEGVPSEFTASFKITLSAASGRTVTVNYATANNTATAGSDYTADSGSIIFNPGETEKWMGIHIADDSVDEPTETFFFNLSGPANATLADAQAVGTIIDDEGEPLLRVSDVFDAAEGNAGTVNAAFTVTLSAASAQPVTVNYATADGPALVPFDPVATAGADYNATSGSLTFQPGETSKTVNVPVRGDLLDEDKEKFSLNLSGAAGAIINDAQGTAFIADDDDEPSYSVGDATVTEGDVGVTLASFTVTLSAPSGRANSVNYSTADGTAAMPGDYTHASGQLVFEPGETSKQVTIQVVGDLDNEANETFFVNLLAPSLATIADAQGVATIVNDDAVTRLQFSQATFNASESAHFVTVTVTRTGDAAIPVAVDFATSDGAATERRDYTAVSGTLRFSAGETSKTFDVLLTDDAYTEPDESIILTLSNVVGDASPGGQTSAAVVIAANDNPAPAGNPIDTSSEFVRQHYHDFLNREPDASGLNFWTGEIESCGADAGCREVKRVNVSAAFFLSIEFQETGYLAYRTYKAAFGDATSPNVEGTVPVVRLGEFLKDTRRIGEGVVVGPGDWQSQLAANKQAYMLEFTQSPRFLAEYPLSMSLGDFVVKLRQNAGVALNGSEQEKIAAYVRVGPDQLARAGILQVIAESEALKQQEKNRAYVLMQFYGYLRRNPDDPQDTDFRGWRFWLDKLDEFNGDAVAAEMVKAFLNADEYRNRFAQ